MITEIIYLSAFVLYTFLFFSTIILLFKSIFKNKKLKLQIVHGEIEKSALISHIEQLESAKDSAEAESTEGFLKFVSQSRDWAFTYIEDVQQALTVYDVALNTDDAKIINDAYNKLISFLPDDVVK
jgi:hypothetical protein